MDLKKTGKALMLGGLLVGTAACGSNNESSDEPQGAQDVSIYSMSSTYEGEIRGYVGKYLQDELGVNVNVIPNSVGGTSRLETRLTTGELGDLIVFTTQKDLNRAKTAGIIEDLTEYKEKLPNVTRFEDAVARAETIFEGLYGIPTTVSQEAEVTKTNPTWLPSMRYDYYKELGSPEIETYWDYGVLAEQMVEAHPETENGDKFYALSLFSEWDGNSVNQLRSIAKSQGYTDTDGVNRYEFINVSVLDDSYEDILSEDSLYLQALKWANDLHKKGLLDPDSASQTWEDYLKKAEKGQSAIMPWGYTGELNFNPVNPELTSQGKGYKLVPNNELLVADQKTTTYGNNWFWAVSKNAKNKDKALELLDFLYSDEGHLFWENGPQGIMWDINDDGKPYLTELGSGNWEAQAPEEAGGGALSETFKKLVNGPSVDQQSVSPILNEPANRSVWETTLLESATELDKQWTEDHDGALNSKEYLLENGLLASYDIADVPLVERGDELDLTYNQVGAVIKEYSWQMIYARDDETFDSLKNEMIEKAKNLGYDRCVESEQTIAQAWFAAR